MRRLRRSGHTLVEALMSLLVIGICVGLVADLFTDTMRTVAFQEERDDGREVVKAALSAVASEVEQAVEIRSATSTKEAATLVLRRIFGPDAVGDQPMPLTTDLSLPRLATVRWAFDSKTGHLRREAHGRSLIMVSGLEAFEVAMTSDAGGRIVTLRAFAQSPGRERRAMARMIMPRPVPLPGCGEAP